ncbi:NAD(P)-dependent oxidoreductase [Streptomyces sp. NPDC058470]|uniref:NAD(P)-dependent oxidoreductase n=1 Tax=Streptomyces sp. NPDC058470 TaxID=3346515 RepID=UPI0036581142
MAGIVVFGAGGRAGRAVTDEARRRGHRVTAVVREPGRYPELGVDGVSVVRGDVTDPVSVAGVVGGHAAAVHAVSPFSGPEQGLDSLDPEFFVRAADSLLGGLAGAGVRRLVAVGLFANLLGADGRAVMDDPEAFPAEIRPFALAHAEGLRRLRDAAGEEKGGREGADRNGGSGEHANTDGGGGEGADRAGADREGAGRAGADREGTADVDWVMLTPPARLEDGAPRTGRYRFGGESAPDGAAHLSYADLAVAVLDEIEAPTLHRTRVSVFNPGSPLR